MLLSKAPMKNTLTLTVLLLAANAALADDAAVRQCRTLPDATSRLACYDAMPLGQGRTAAAPAAAAVSAPATPAAAAAQAQAGFGRETIARKAEAEITAIDSTVEGDFAGWGPNTRFKLANGQVWRIVDGSAADLAPARNQKVRIERNRFGTMFLSVAGSNHSAKVRRVE